MRAIVHKTKGKMDLRSITVFGMNVKPETTMPIGYFGTGLKYAIAVLMRHKIPIRIIIDGKVWVIEGDPATFRNKSFTELYICSTTVGGLIRKRIKLLIVCKKDKKRLQELMEDRLVGKRIISKPKIIQQLIKRFKKNMRNFCTMKENLF